MIGTPAYFSHKAAERGITGLETAILLVAFVVITAVFAYTTLSSGLFAAGESQEAVSGGLQTAQQTIRETGSVTARRESIDTNYDRIGDTDSIASITLNLNNAMSGATIDLNPSYILLESPGKVLLEQNTVPHELVINWSSEGIFIPDCAWTVEFIGGNDGDYLLEKDETASITVWLVSYRYLEPIGSIYGLGYGESDPFLDSAADLLLPDDSFSLQIIPENGATLAIDRTLPPTFDSLINLK